MSEDINPADGNGPDPIAMLFEPAEPDEEPTDAGEESAASAEAPEPETEDGDDAEESLYGDDDDDDGAEPQEAAPRQFTVKINGKTVLVDESEVIAGYQRQSDYTSKTSALAEQRRAFESEAQAVAQERAYYAQQLASLAQSYQLPPEPDYRLAQSNPLAYVQARAEWEAQAKHYQAVQAEQQRLAQQVANDQQQHYSRHLASEMERLQEALPDWKDPAKAKQQKRELTEYLRTSGYTDDEISSATDHRAILLAKKAQAYDRLLSSKASVEKKVANAPKTLRPGAAPSGENTNAQRKSALKTLQRTGGVDAAAAWIAMG